MESPGFLLIDVFPIRFRLGEIIEESCLYRKSLDVYMPPRHFHLNLAGAPANDRLKQKTLHVSPFFYRLLSSFDLLVPGLVAVYLNRSSR